MDSPSASRNDRYKRWQFRWSAASGIWFAIGSALLLGGIGWRTAVMAAATVFMLVRASDMLDE